MSGIKWNIQFQAGDLGVTALAVQPGPGEVVFLRLREPGLTEDRVRAFADQARSQLPEDVRDRLVVVHADYDEGFEIGVGPGPDFDGMRIENDLLQAEIAKLKAERDALQQDLKRLQTECNDKRHPGLAYGYGRALYLMEEARGLLMADNATGKKMDAFLNSKQPLDDLADEYVDVTARAARGDAFQQALLETFRNLYFNHAARDWAAYFEAGVNKKLAAAAEIPVSTVTRVELARVLKDAFDAAIASLPNSGLDRAEILFELRDAIQQALNL